MEFAGGETGRDAPQTSPRDIVKSWTAFGEEQKLVEWSDGEKILKGLPRSDGVHIKIGTEATYIDHLVLFMAQLNMFVRLLMLSLTVPSPVVLLD